MLSDRIKELRMIPVHEIMLYKKNRWKHRNSNITALKRTLEAAGYVNCFIVRKNKRGHFVIIDGSIPKETTSNQKFPVLILDITESEVYTIRQCLSFRL
jgi:hypothetical protein